MKLTLNVEEDLLERVRVALGVKSKTEAIHHALSEIDRRHALRTLLAEDFGMSAEDWRRAWNEGNSAQSLNEGPGSPGVEVAAKSSRSRK